MVGLDSTDPVALKKTGDEYARKEDYETAITYYQKAITLDRDYISAWNNLGYSFYKAGNTEYAKLCLEKVHSLKAAAAQESMPENQQPEIVLPDRELPGEETIRAGERKYSVKRGSIIRFFTGRKKPEKGDHGDSSGVGHEPAAEAKEGRPENQQAEIVPPDRVLPSEETNRGGEMKTPAKRGSILGFFSGRQKPEKGDHGDSSGAGNEPPVSVSPETRGFFSFPKKKSEGDVNESPVPAGPETAASVLHMEGGEVFRVKGARSAATIKDSVQLVEGFDRVLEQNPSLSAGFRGIALFSLGRFSEALEDFDRELGQDPGATGIWILRAWVLARLGRNGEALTSCEQALRLDPENFDGWRQMGFVLQGLSREQEALHALDRALSLNPHSAEVWVARGRILHVLSRDHEALQSYDRALAIDPRSSDLWLSRARSLSRLGREDEALLSLEKGIAANPDNPSLFICQGRMFHVLRKFGEALTAYDRALTIRPDDSRTWEAMGGVLHELGKFRDEAAAYDRAIAIDPGNALLYRKRGDAFALSGKDAEAARDFRKGLEFRPGDIECSRRLGMALGRAGKTDEAREILQPLLESSSNGNWTLKDRGEALLLLGRYREALVVFREALSLDPDDAKAQEGVRKAETALGTHPIRRQEGPIRESMENGTVSRK
jgi:tetratricopeptide (TPR) repeat protein